MKKLTELQEQKLQRVMREYDEAMRKFDEGKINGKLRVSTWGWIIGILIPIVLAFLILKVLSDPFFRFVNYAMFWNDIAPEIIPPKNWEANEGSGPITDSPGTELLHIYEGLQTWNDTAKSWSLLEMPSSAKAKDTCLLRLWTRRVNTSCTETGGKAAGADT